MSAERIDHRAEAHRLLTQTVGNVSGGFMPTAAEVSRAQAHATLALVEQQRTSNLIEYSRLVATAGTGAIDRLNERGVPAQIREALGLS